MPIRNRPTPPFLRHSRVRSLPSALLPLALTGVEVVYDDGADIGLRLLFNTTPGNPLADVSGADPGQWVAHCFGFIYTGTIIENEAFNALFINLSSNTESSSDQTISYAADPSDIADAAGGELAAIDGFIW